MNNIIKFQREFILKFIFAAGGLLIVVGSMQLGLGSLKNPGPGLFPLLCGCLIFFLSLILLFYKKEPSQNEYNEYNIKKLFSIIIIFILWILLMPLLGYIVVTFLSAISFAKAMGLEGWRKPLFLSCGITGFCYFLFDVYLYIDLPRDFLGLEGVLSAWNIL